MSTMTMRVDFGIRNGGRQSLSYKALDTWRLLCARVLMSLLAC